MCEPWQYQQEGRDGRTRAEEELIGVEPLWLGRSVMFTFDNRTPWKSEERRKIKGKKKERGGDEKRRGGQQKEAGGWAREEKKGKQKYKKERLCLVLMKSDKDVIQVEQCQCEKFEL